MRTPPNLAAVLLILVACGGGSSNPDAPTPDAATDAPGACGKLAAPTATISAYPGMFAGSTKGKGSNLNVGENVCTTQVRDLWFDQKGEDTVVELTNLTVGMTYGVTLDTQEDLGFYAIRACTDSASGPISGQCDLFADARLTAETGSFVAAGTVEYIVIDSADDPSAPPTGAFTLKVIAAQCVDDTACSGATPACEAFTCTECHDSFDCGTAAAAACSPEHACVAGPTLCTGDDVRDTGTADDGPASATTIAMPTATPTTVSGAVCDSPRTEGDWFKIVSTGTTSIGVALDFTGATNDLDVTVYDTAGTMIAAGIQNAGINEALTADLMAGTYYVVVTQFGPANTTVAVAYTLTLNQIECTTEFGCSAAATPTCGPTGRCVVGPAVCTGDDVGDNGTGDDGPAAARSLTGAIGVATALPGAVCSNPGSERDYYKVVVAAGEGLDLSLAWTGSDDLDIVVSDATGVLYGLSFYQQPEVVHLTYLPAGTYYIGISLFSASPVTASTTYTITATRTAAQSCTSSTDCAASFSTQVYRGDCAAGTCQFIAPGSRANGAACDSGNDCTSTRCSYVRFESNAQHSVCTTTCAMTSDCTSVGAGLTCSTGLASNFCVPSCASDLDCGVDTNNPTLTTGQPWSYFTCTSATGVCAL